MDSRKWETHRLRLEGFSPLKSDDSIGHFENTKEGKWLSFFFHQIGRAKINSAALHRLYQSSLENQLHHFLSSPLLFTFLETVMEKIPRKKIRFRIEKDITNENCLSMQDFSTNVESPQFWNGKTEFFVSGLLTWGVPKVL